jgi:hypothetical protein
VAASRRRQLLRTPQGRYGGRRESWLLLKHDDEFARRTRRNRRERARQRRLRQEPQEDPREARGDEPAELTMNRSVENPVARVAGKKKARIE